MTDRPIIFSSIMIRALLEGRKTQTRRPLYRLTKSLRSACFDQRYPPPLLDIKNPDHMPGETWTLAAVAAIRPNDRLWVREAWGYNRYDDGQTQAWKRVVYRADPGAQAMDNGDSAPWRSPIHMPRALSRLTLTVTDVRVQRLQEISEEDAIAEGCEETSRDNNGNCWHEFAREEYRRLWDSLHGPGAWNTNPWVCAISFRTIHANIDSPEARAA